MHILTGLLLSKLLSGAGQKKAFKGFRGIVEVRHALPGRIRFHIPVLKMDIEKGQLLQKELAKAASIEKVFINPLLGSVLIIFDNNKIDEVTLTAVLARLLRLEKEIRKTPRSLIGQELGSLLKSANSSVYEQSNGLLDLNTAITLSFLSLGVWSVFRNPKVLPAGISLIYWAYNNASMQAKGEL